MRTRARILSIVGLTAVLMAVAVPASASAPWVVVQRGDHGLNVRAVQALLEDHGYAVPLDARFGWKTEQAVKAFQKDHGLATTGVVAKPTWVKLVVTMQQGDRGDCVKIVQRKLSHIYDLKVDGVFGAKTKSVVEQFQKDAELVVDGVVGKFTWKHLLLIGGPSCLSGFCG